jgi:uncharacterized membrane protein
VLLIIAVIAAITWLSITPQKEKPFTEFYILGVNGKAESYPETLKAGDGGALIVGIVNRENAVVNYRLLVKMDDQIITEIEPMQLANGQKWEQQVSFIPREIGDHQKVEFLLYKDEGTNAYLSLNLWIDVK